MFQAVNDSHKLILEELRKIRPQKTTNQGVMICCPFHADRTPSLSINLVYSSTKPVGLYNCFGCPATGRWNSLAKKLGLRTVDERAAQQITEFLGRRPKPNNPESVEDEALAAWELDFVEPWPADRRWRGFPGDFIAEIGGKLAVDTKHKREVLVLTVSVGDQVRGMVKAQLKKQKGQLSYLNSSGQWAQEYGLFGYDLATKLIAAGATRLFVVEGPRDALRLLYYGIPAVAVLGAKVWSSTKRDLLVASGAELFVLWMDNDTAGISATNRLRKSLGEMAEVSFVNAKALLATAVSKYDYEDEKIDVASTPVQLFKRVVRKYGATAVTWSPGRLSAEPVVHPRRRQAA